jgi:XTP/dITP diphosphohydrolase
MKLCFASNNPKKLEEITHKLKGTGLEILSAFEAGITDDIPETGNTLRENALQKAQFVFDRYGLFCFADDTGLEVDCLNGVPGVYSARYAGPVRDAEDNMNKLLREMEPFADRKARFVTVIALIHPTGTFFFEGSVEGEITQEKRGTGGFGYDPVFRPNGMELTFAQMSPEMKNQLSHRAIAVDKLIQFLKSI